MNIYDRAVNAIRDRRREELDDGYAVWQNAVYNNDELHKAFSAYQEEMIRSAKGEENELPKARAAYESRMKAMGLSKDKIEPPPRCKLCGDSGYRNGKYCSCVIKTVIQSDSANLAIPPADFDEMKRTAPPAVKKVYKLAEEYIDGYPDGKKPFLMLFGAAGTGKTILASAILDALMKKGASAVAVTAFDFVRRALEYHTQFSITDYTDRFTPTIDCDLLIIDDLGRESTLKNVTKEYLYSVVNERWLKKKYTIVTSNLHPKEVFSRYGDAIASRLFDKNISTNIIINGKNSRLS